MSIFQYEVYEFRHRNLPLRLSTPVPISGHLELPEGIFLDTELFRLNGAMRGMGKPVKLREIKALYHSIGGRGERPSRRYDDTGPQAGVIPGTGNEQGLGE